MITPDSRFMRLALDACAKGIDHGQSPFGACIVRGERIIVVAHNRVWQTTDITAHAEVTALRAACLELNTVDLAGCVIYSTTEPCPMCFSAIHWANCDGIVYGASIADAAAAGFRELPVSNEQLKQLGGSRVEIVGGFMRTEALDLFQRFAGRTGRRVY
jgi:tRNA(Arg) A34 adenosine deaminase TadA